MNHLIAAALESEVGHHFKGENIVLTGVGKINAAYALTKALHTMKPAIVFNLGTAGSSRHAPGTVLICNRFYQRDMDASPLGFAAGVTPYSDVPEILEYGRTIEGYLPSLCGTGDNFNVATQKKDAHCDAFDMEAYSLALVCKNENTPFICVKYITDGADSEAAGKWIENLDAAAVALHKAYRDICRKI